MSRTLTRSLSKATGPAHSNKRIDDALQSIRSLLAEKHLAWHDTGRHPDCQFTSFIHSTQKIEPDLKQILDTRRKCRDWLFRNPPESVVSPSEWRDSVKSFGISDNRKQGDENSLRGLAGAYGIPINVIIVGASSHHTKTYNPENKPLDNEIWLIYLDLPNMRHYMSTLKNDE